MKHILALITALAIVLFNSGCALTRTEKKISYTPRIRGDVVARTPNNRVEIGEIKDKRGLEDPTIIFLKKNLNGETMSGSYAADRPLAAILKDGLEQGLTEKGFRPINASKTVRVNAFLEDFSYELVVGFSKSTCRPKMIVKVELIDATTGRSLWRDTFVGRSSITSGDIPSQAVTLTIDDVVTQLIISQSFRDAVE